MAASAVAMLWGLHDGDGRAADLHWPAQPQSGGYDWSGAYFGASLGGDITSNYNADTESNTTFSFDNNNGGLVPITLDTGTGGLIGGLQAGYNRQFGAYVLGAEADISALQAGGSSSFTSSSTLLGSTFTTSASERLDYLSTLRLRAGYTPLDRWLVYATGGLALGDLSTASSVVMNANPANIWNGSSHRTSVGYALGGGIEYALTANITLKGEYLYYDIGSRNTIASGDAAVQGNAALSGLSYASKSTAAGSVIRMGVNFKF